MAGPPKIIVDSEEEDEDEYLDQQGYSEVESSAPPATENEEFDEEEEEEYPEDEEVPSNSDDEVEEREEEEEVDQNYDFDDASDMNDDLELKDEDDEESQKSKTRSVPRRKSIKITIKPPKKPNTPTPGANASGTDSNQTLSQRSTRKRQVSYYAVDDEEEEDEEGELEDEYEIAPSRQQPAAKKLKKAPSSKKPVERRNIPQQKYLDPELVLTDEETEYNPSANTDFSKMTERQRSRYSHEEDDGSGQFIELDETGKKAKLKSSVHQETEEEIALRKAENARKRQDYKNKMLEEEKRDTLNKLLKRRATKSREIINDDERDGGESSNSALHKMRRPTLEHDAFIRYVNNTTSLNGNSVLAFK